LPGWESIPGLLNRLIYSGLDFKYSGSDFKRCGNNVKKTTFSFFFNTEYLCLALEEALPRLDVEHPAVLMQELGRSTTPTLIPQALRGLEGSEYGSET
jgi:hypothetical protein